MNSTLTAIAERFSCRAFTEQVPSDTDLQAIAQAAIQSPSGMNRQNWHIIVVKNKAIIDEMDEAGMSRLSAMPDKSMYERIQSRGGRLYYNAPCMMVVAIKQSTPPGAELIDCGIVAQNIVLAATSLGIANLHCGFVGFAFAGDRAQEFKKKLQFPEGYECGMGVLLGYAKEPASPHAPDQQKITWIE